MRKITCLFLLLLFVLGILLPCRVTALVEYDAKIPQLAFAAQEIEAALKEAGRGNLNVTLSIKADASSPEAFQISSVRPTQVEITGSDTTGAMYGELEVADLLRLLPVLARTHFLDWNSTLKEVEKEVVTVQNEGDFPEVRFTNLADGARVPAGTELRVEVEATDGHGIREVKLYLNGVLLNPHATKPQVWSGRSDELLRELKPGIYHLKAVAEDKTGVRSQQEIQIAAGDVSQNSAADWRDEIHQVILNEGERLMDGDIHDFPRLECFITLEEDGRLALFRGAPRGREGLIWKTRGKADRPTPQPTPPRFYTVLENGQLTVYRGTPDNPDVILWQSSKPSEPGPFRLGITTSKRLIIYRDEGKKTEIVWRSPVRE